MSEELKQFEVYARVQVDIVVTVMADSGDAAEQMVQEGFLVNVQETVSQTSDGHEPGMTDWQVEDPTLSVMSVE